MESASLFEYNEDELLATIAASVYPNAKIRGVEWSVRYPGHNQPLPHADYLNMINIVTQLIRTITDLPGTTAVNLISTFDLEGSVVFDIERKLSDSLTEPNQCEEIRHAFERIKPDYVGQLPVFSVPEQQQNAERYTITFRLHGNELYPHLKQKKKVVIAETDRGLLSSMADALSRQGFAVAVAEDPARILTTIEAFHPDILLISLNLGIQNGLDISTKIKLQYPQRSFTMLALLASSGSAESGILKEAGFAGFLLKPRSAGMMKDFVLEFCERIRIYE